MKLPTIIVLPLILLLTVAGALGQGIRHVPDPNFDAKVSPPAYAEKHPRALFDEAHFNLNASGGNYKGFVDLVRNDGYEVNLNGERFSPEILKDYNVLIIVNAVGAKGIERYDTPAFTEEECRVIYDWVNSGGALLLIAGGISPYGKAAENLAKRFNVEMTNGRTIDDPNKAPESPVFSIGFTRDNKLLLDHPLIEGRNSSERIKRVVTYGGQPLKASPGSSVILKLSKTAMEMPGVSRADLEEARANADANKTASGRNGVPAGAIPIPQKEKISVAGLAQAVALTVGKGRVIIVGDGDMFSAQLLQGQIARVQGKESIPLGMNAPGNDNRQFALNAMHWLSGLLSPGNASQNTNAPQPADANSGGIASTAKTEAAQSLSSAMLPQSGKGALAPQFIVTSLDSKQFDLSALRGKVVVLNLWFLGCPPCIKEIPDLNKLVTDYQDRDVIFLSLAMDGEDALRAFLQKKEFKYNLAGNSTDIIVRQYDVSIFPTHLIIGKDGKIETELVGANKFKKLREELERVVSKK